MKLKLHYLVVYIHELSVANVVLPMSDETFMYFNGKRTRRSFLGNMLCLEDALMRHLKLRIAACADPKEARLEVCGYIEQLEELFVFEGPNLILHKRMNITRGRGGNGS